MKMLRALLVLCAVLVAHAMPCEAWAATLLPEGKQQFFLANGQPAAGGSVYFYIPSTTTPKATWQDPAATIYNTNPVQLDAGGFATVYGVGQYRMIVQDYTGATIYDALTADTSGGSQFWTATVTGGVNNIVIASSGFGAQDGQIIAFVNAFTNTGPTTLTVNGNAYQIVYTNQGGQTALQAGQMVAGEVSTLQYVAATGQLQLLNPTPTQNATSIAAAATTDLGAALGTLVNVTGQATITSFGTTAKATNALYTVSFANSMQIVKAAALLTPNGQNINVVAGGVIHAQALGSGNWQVLSYSPPPVNAQVGTSYTLSGNDCGNTVTFSNSSAIAVTVPQAQTTTTPATNFPSTCSITVQNVGTGIATLAYSTGSTVSGTYGGQTLGAATNSLLAPGVSYVLSVSSGNWAISGATFVPGSVLLTSTLSGASSFAENTALLAGYNEYAIELINFLPSTTTNLQVQFVTGGGIGSVGTTQTGANYNWANQGFVSSSILQAGAINAQTSISMVNGANWSNTTSGLNLRMRIFNPSSATTTKSITWDGGIASSGAVGTVAGAGNFSSGTATLTGLSWAPTAGTMSGVYRVIGVN